MAAVQQQTTQLEFHQAMADFKVMFPEMDHDVIEAVLRANQGAVDATIDQLLAMSTDNENERLRNEMEKKEKQQWTSPQPSSAAAAPPSAASASSLAAIKATPSQSSHSSQSRQASSPLLSLPQSQQHNTPTGGPTPVSNTPILSSHSPSRRIQAAASAAPPTGNSVSPSKTKEVVATQQLIPSPVASATSSPRKAEDRDAHARLGPNGESSSDREDGAQMIELDGDTDQKDVDEQIPLRVIHGWEPPLLGQLPDDFLRITVSSSSHWTPSSKKPQALMLSQQLLQQRYAENQERRGALLGAGGAVGDPDLDRFLEDERIALFLQNEEFMAELRWNKDFLSTLEKDQLQRGDCDSPPEDHMGSFPLGKSLSSSGHDEDALFKERLRNMGKVSRKKFAQLARVFTGRKKRSGSGSSGAKHILSQGPAPSRDNLLLNAEPLLPDDDDEEEEVERFDGEEGGSEIEDDVDQGESGRCRRAQRHRLGGERRKRSGQRVGGDGKEDEEEDEGGGDFHHHHLRESHNGGISRRAESRD